MTFRSLKRFGKLSIPLVGSSAPWIYFLAVNWSVPQAHWEGALIFGLMIGAVSFLATGPIAAAQLHLMSRESQIPLRTHLLVYFAVCAPTLTFQAFALSSSLLGAFMPGASLLANERRNSLLTLLLGITLYAIVDLIFGVMVRRIDRNVS
jgi:hypothetical protein